MLERGGPLIKSQLQVENNQRLGGRTSGLIRLKTGIRRTIVVLPGCADNIASTQSLI
jgi:hypothetical protein